MNHKGKDQEKRKKGVTKQQQVSNLPMITLNIWTKFPNQKTEWLKFILKMKKQDPSTCCLQEIHLALRTHTDWKERKKKKIFHVDGKTKQ